MKPIALALIGIAALTGCDGVHHVQTNAIDGSGKYATKKLSVGPGKALPMFTKIRSEGSIGITVVEGTESEAEIKGDDNLLEIVKLDVKGDTLVIDTTKRFSTSLGVNVIVTVPKVEGLEIAGSGGATIAGVTGHDLALSVSGSGSIDADGTVDSLAADISGSGSIDAKKLKSTEAKASVSGSGSIWIGDSTNLKADIAGSGGITYQGSPNLEKSVTGSGSVEKG